MNDPYNDGLLALRKKYCDMYKEHPDTVLFVLSKATAIREVFYTLYQHAIKDKSLMPIEELSKGQKEILWNQVKGYKKEDAIKICKCLWLIQMVTK